MAEPKPTGRNLTAPRVERPWRPGDQPETSLARDPRTDRRSSSGALGNDRSHESTGKE